MSNVKISDLPVIASPPAMNDVLIINDTSANTTCKATVSDFFADGTLHEYTPTITEGLTSNQTLLMQTNRITPYFGRLLIRTTGTTTITNTTANYIPLRLYMPSDFSSLADVNFVGNVTDISGMTIGDGTAPVTGDIIGMFWRPVDTGSTHEFRLSFLVKHANSIWTQAFSIAPNSQVTFNSIFLNTFAWGHTPGFTQ